MFFSVSCRVARLKERSLPVFLSADIKLCLVVFGGCSVPAASSSSEVDCTRLSRKTKSLTCVTYLSLELRLEFYCGTVRTMGCATPRNCNGATMRNEDRFVWPCGDAASPQRQLCLQGEQSVSVGTCTAHLSYIWEKLFVNVNRSSCVFDGSVHPCITVATSVKPCCFWPLNYSFCGKTPESFEISWLWDLMTSGSRKSRAVLKDADKNSLLATPKWLPKVLSWVCIGRKQRTWQTNAVQPASYTYTLAWTH